MEQWDSRLKYLPVVYLDQVWKTDD